MSNESEIEWKVEIRNNIEVPKNIVPILTISNPNTQIMRVDLDGGFHVNECIPATDAAKEVLRIMKEQWFQDAQATKIREQQDRIHRLEEDYYDLIMQVERVFDGETRHQTAKRYIKNAE